MSGSCSWCGEAAGMHACLPGSPPPQPPPPPNPLCIPEKGWHDRECWADVNTCAHVRATNAEPTP